jgi:hypothetical protein
MALPARIPKAAKRASRWISKRHRTFVAGFACCKCGSMKSVEAAHVRIGSGAGMGQKPDDWRTVSLCSACHRGPRADAQHAMGERSFWAGIDYERLIAEFTQASPVKSEILAVQAERAPGIAA